MTLNSEHSRPVSVNLPITTPQTRVLRNDTGAIIDGQLSDTDGLVGRHSADIVDG